MSALMPSLVHGKGLVEIACAVQLVVDQGEEFLYCVNPDTGSHYPRCPVVGWNRFPLKVPTAPWRGDALTAAPRVVLGHRAGKLDPVVLDAVRRPDRVTMSEAPADGESDAAAPSVKDVVVENGGTRVIVRDDGRVTIQAGGDVEVTINGGTFRVSDAGDSSGRVMLASPGTSALNSHVSAFNALVRALGGVVPDPVTGAVTKVALQAALATVPTLGTLDETALRSQAVHVPNKAG